MPKPVPQHCTTATERVPVGLFLPPKHRGDTASWSWLSPTALAHLVHRYTAAGDTVLNLDGHPAVTAASRYLHRRAATPLTDRDAAEAAVAFGTIAAVGGESGLADLTHTLSRWRRALRPGGHLVLALTGPPVTPEAGSLRTTVITAARAAGLVYHQHIPVVLVPLTEHDGSHADVDRHEADERVLPSGQHNRTYRDLLIFVTTTIQEADRGPHPHEGSAERPPNGIPGSVWLTGQHPSRDLRRGRYARESVAHPGKMLPTIARHAIRVYSEPGDIVADPMAGIGTTVVEAMHLGRHGIGVEYEARWAALSAVNVDLARRQGATGTGDIYTGDSRHLPALIPHHLHGRIALVITSPPYGSSTHGQVRTPGSRRGKVSKINHKYGGTDNLAYRGDDAIAEGFTDILTGCAALLRPGGHVVITARPYRRHGELIDITGMVTAAGTNAGLTLVDECVALMAGVRDGVLIPRASFFQLKNIRHGIAGADPQWLVQHEDVAVFQRPGIAESSREGEGAEQRSAGRTQATGSTAAERPARDDTATGEARDDRRTR